jgi:hypothetical protein
MVRRVSGAGREVDEERLVGVSDFSDLTHSMAWFVMSVMK